MPDFTIAPCWFRAALALGLVAAAPVRAQDDEVKTPPPNRGQIQIVFTPPPMDGTFSLGVYAATDGRLVRVLHREAEAEKFILGLNGLITSWDGADDAGKLVPPGKYDVRGYCVGALEIEGEAYWGNDWVVDAESPRLAEFGEMTVSDGALRVPATTADGKRGVWRRDLETGAESFVGDSESEPVEPPPVSGSEPAPATTSTPAPEWKIETLEEDGQKVRVVTQRQGDEVLRALEIPVDQPQPVAVAAVPGRDEIFLSERGANLFRLRGLRLKETLSESDGQKISNWEVFFSKTLHKTETFADIAPELPTDRPVQPQDKVKIRLVSNPLERTAARSLEVAVSIDPKGSFLRTADGLPLRTVTDTPNLKWAVIGPAAAGANGIVLFQSDGAVVEEFRVRKLANMMAFDAGRFEWAGPQ
ncbi:MAG: hypothetical protein ABI680_07915 [Chthoniobacteraceae bacterium]